MLHMLAGRRGHIRIPQRNHRQILEQHLFSLMIVADRIIHVGLARGVIDQFVEGRAPVIAVVQALAVGR